MAILAIFYGKGVTKDLYDIMIKEAGWKENHPVGGMLHAAAFDANGDARVADIWESEEALNAYFASALAPVFQKHNIPAPSVEIYPIHNVDAYPEIDRYKVK
jgi:hypothetical protein